MGKTEGQVKVLVDEEGQILGVHAVGPLASEIIGEAGLALEMSASLEDLLLTVHAHPTLHEAVREACENARREAIHILNR